MKTPRFAFASISLATILSITGVLASSQSALSSSTPSSNIANRCEDPGECKALGAILDTVSNPAQLPTWVRRATGRVVDTAYPDARGHISDKMSFYPLLNYKKLRIQPIGLAVGNAGVTKFTEILINLKDGNTITLIPRNAKPVLVPNSYVYDIYFVRKNAQIKSIEVHGEGYAKVQISGLVSY